MDFFGENNSQRKDESERHMTNFFHCSFESKGYENSQLWQILKSFEQFGNISWNSYSKIVNRNIKNLKNNVMAGTAFKVITFVEPKR